MSADNSCGKLIKQISNELEKNANNALRPRGITMTQVSALLVLNENPETRMPLKELEKALHVAQSTAAGITNRLKQHGYIEEFCDSRDKRIKIISITQKGKDCCLEAYEGIKAAETKLLSGLTDTEQEIFRTLLKKVRNTLV